VSDRGGNPETKDLLGDSVCVLPYLDARVWIDALSKECRRNNGAKLNSEMTFGDMFEKTMTLLQKI
jgi:hypothetical protein